MPDFPNFPFESRYLTLDDGTKIHYVDEGDGIPIVLLHGNPTWSYLYRHIIEELKSEYRCIAFDYPGFGFSDSPDNYGFTASEQAQASLEIIKKLDLPDFYMMMQDWGGPIGFYVASQMPEKVKGFVIGNTWAWVHRSWRFRVFSGIVGGIIGQLASRSFNGVVHLFLQLGLHEHIPKSDYDMYLLPFKDRQKRHPTHIFPKQLIQAHDFLAHVEQSLPNLSEKPALLVWGERDFAFKAEEKHRFEASFPNHKTVILPNASHFVQEDAPQEISQAIREWIA